MEFRSNNIRKKSKVKKLCNLIISPLKYFNHVKKEDSTNIIAMEQTKQTNKYKKYIKIEEETKKIDNVNEYKLRNHKNKIIYLHKNKNNLPRNGWFQNCFFCDTITSITVHYLLYETYNYNYNIYVFLCPCCNNYYRWGKEELDNYNKNDNLFNIINKEKLDTYQYMLYKIDYHIQNIVFI